jgi:DNA-binding LacI/PurR family transcriptional regulator
VLITDARLDDPRYALVAELGLEAVVVGHPDRASGLPGVAADERTALAGAVGTLVDLGHECVAHVSGPAMLVHCAERRDAWRDGCWRAACRPARWWRATSPPRAARVRPNACCSAGDARRRSSTPTT